MNYIKKIVSNKSEAKYIKMDLIESKGFIHKIILVEANFSHSGIKRTYQFQEVIDSDYFTEDEKSRIIYLKIDITKLVYPNTFLSKELHYNERIIRGKFTDYIKLKSTDIIFSLDADEVLYSHTYINIISSINKNKNKAYLIKLHNLVYRPDYLWANFDFIAPTACRVDFYNSFKMIVKSKFKKFKQWRYHGELYEFYGGVHFNWHLTPKEMEDKLSNYAHRDLFIGKGYDEDYFKNCISKKIFFDPDKECEIKTINLRDNDILPDSFYFLKDDFKYLLNDYTI